MESILDKFEKKLDAELIDEKIEKIKISAIERVDANYLKQLFSFIDLTSLNNADNEEVIKKMILKVNDLSVTCPDIPPVAAVCVWPSLVRVPSKELKVPGVKIASVAGGFPSSQTFLEVKCREAEMAVEAGADEIDVVMNTGSFIAGDYINVAGEINTIKRAIGNAHLKVILETGLLESPGKIRDASLIAMQAGADFIKTSTGKLSPAATYQAVFVMADAAADFYRRTGRFTGIKPAGGITEPSDAAVYASIVEALLGEKWMTPGLFRIGASRLAGNILEALGKPSPFG